MEWRQRVVAGVLLAAVVLSGQARDAGAQPESGRTAAEPPAAGATPKESEYARHGWYAGLGLVYAPSAFELEDAERDLDVTLGGNNPFGLDARLGYRLHPRVALEGDYQLVPGFAVERGGGPDLADLRTHVLTVNGKLFLMTETLQPYLVGGVGFLHANANATLPGFAGAGTGFAGRVGVGADYYLRPDVVFDLEFSVVLPTGPVADVRFLPLVFGAAYRF